MEAASTTNYHIHINRRLIEAHSSPLTGLQILALGDYGPDYDLYLLQGEGDQTGGRKIEHNEALEIKDGMHFRAIPGNANFGQHDR